MDSDTAKWAAVALATITLLITLYKGAIWVGDIEAKVVENAQELDRRSPYVGELLELKVRVAEVKDEIDRRRLPTNRIEGIEEDLARLEDRADYHHYPGHERDKDIIVPPEDRVVP